MEHILVVIYALFWWDVYAASLGLHLVLVWNGNAVDVHHRWGNYWNPADCRRAAFELSVIFLPEIVWSMTEHF